MVFKLIAYLFTGSASMLSEAIHSLADLLNQVRDYYNCMYRDTISIPLHCLLHVHVHVYYTSQIQIIYNTCHSVINKSIYTINYYCETNSHTGYILYSLQYYSTIYYYYYYYYYPSHTHSVWEGYCSRRVS